MSRLCALWKRCLLAAAVAWSSLLGVHAHAVTTSWNTNVSGSFTNAANWDNGVPGSGDTAIFNRGFVGYTVTFPGGTIFEPPVNYAINYLRVNNNQVNFDWNDSFPLQASPSLSVLNPDVSIVIGENAGEVGILNTTLNSLTGAKASIGRAPGANGTLGVVGGTFSMSGRLDVGDSGTGTLNVTNGGRVESSFGVIGLEESSIGTVTVTGAGSSWTDIQGVRVGSDGTGALTIEAGGSVSSYQGIIGSEFGSNGAVTVTGAGSTWTCSDALIIGGVGFSVGHGTGTLTLEAGGSVSNTVGYIAGENSKVTVTGAGSTWTNSRDLYIGFGLLGNVGGGTLTIEAGGSVSNDSGAIAPLSTVTVTGAGSTWTNSGELSIGGSDFRGTLLVSGGGAVFSNVANVGTPPGALGMVTVDGTGSTWTNSGDLSIGGSDFSGPSDTLVVSSGGRVSVGGLLSVEPAGTVAGNSTLSAVVVNRGAVSPGLNPGVVMGVSPGALDVDGSYLQSAEGRLQLRLAGTTPGSAFDQLHVSGAVILNGTLSVALANSFMPSAGDAFDILDWGSLSGTFSTIALPTLATDLSWDTSQLYTTGVLRVTGDLPGDYNDDGTVDAADYTLWRDNLGSATALPNDDTPGVGPDDYTRWKTHFGAVSAGNGGGASSGVTASAGAVPEPSSFVLLALATFAAVIVGRGQRRGRG